MTEPLFPTTPLSSLGLQLFLHSQFSNNRIEGLSSGNKVKVPLDGPERKIFGCNLQQIMTGNAL